MLEAFLKQLQKLEAGVENSYLIAFSGGVDSLVLTHLLKSGGYNISLAHCNFNLREEAGEDQAFCVQYASELGIPCFTKSFDTKDFAGEENLSIQMAARELRYQWFYELMQQKEIDLLCTAHHADDQLESILLAINRAPGIAGIKGIQAKQDNCIRPLLAFSKEEIIKYAHQESLRWREDKTNAEVHYQRNFIRHKIIPKLKEVNPGILKSALKFSGHISEAKNFIDLTVEKSLRQSAYLFGSICVFDLHRLKSLPQLGFTLFHFLNPLGFNRDVVDQLVLAFDEPSGQIFESNNYRLNLDCNKLWLLPKEDLFEEDSFENNAEVSNELYYFRADIIKSSRLTNIENKLSIWVEEGDLPLKIRRKQAGDRIELSKGGSKKLKDHFVEAKIPKVLKSQIPVVEDNQGNILFVPPSRVKQQKTGGFQVLITFKSELIS